MTATPTRRRRLGPVVLLAFLIVPVIEIYVLIQIGQVIGAWWTILLLVIDSIIGAWLIRREGAKAFVALRTALNSGRMPGKELADGALILIGGTLMLTPGFVTDILAVFLILPLTRPLFRGLLARAVTARLTVVPMTAPGQGRTGPSGAPNSAPRNATRPEPTDPTVVRGEVIDD